MGSIPNYSQEILTHDAKRRLKCKLKPLKNVVKGQQTFLKV